MRHRFGKDTIVDYHPSEDVVEFDRASSGALPDLLAAETEEDSDVIIRAFDS